MTNFQEATQKLLDAHIAFSVHTPGKTSDMWVITVTESINNEQLSLIVSLGGSMTPDGKCMILGSERTE